MLRGLQWNENSNTKQKPRRLRLSGSVRLVLFIHCHFEVFLIFQAVFFLFTSVCFSVSFCSPHLFSILLIAPLLCSHNTPVLHWSSPAWCTLGIWLPDGASRATLHAATSLKCLFVFAFFPGGWIQDTSSGTLPDFFFLSECECFSLSHFDFHSGAYSCNKAHVGLTGIQR